MNLFQFGELHKDYHIRVFNEREVRASAGILLALAMSAFFNAFLVGNFQPLRYFVALFLVDFSIRLFINPKYSPTMTLGRILVSAQKPEYTGAPQKKFAWAIGYLIAVFMFFRVVVLEAIGPLNLLICILCLTFLFFESVLGICIGCYIYNHFNKEKAALCPGGICEIKKKEKIQNTSIFEFVLMLLIFSLFILSIAVGILPARKNNPSNCEIPQWVRNMNHEEQYRMHHGCN